MDGWIAENMDAYNRNDDQNDFVFIDLTHNS